jgi:hypothetical protein
MSQQVATDRPMHALRATAGEVPRSWSTSRRDGRRLAAATP